FHDVALAGESEPLRPDGQRAQQGHAFGNFVTGEVRVFVRDVTADGVLVFLAMTFNRLQGRPARAVEEVVEEGEGERVHEFAVYDLRFTIEVVEQSEGKGFTKVHQVNGNRG